MQTLRSFVRRLRDVGRSEELDRDLSDELASHLAMQSRTTCALECRRNGRVAQRC
jgi:hypothetical protein